MKQILQDLTNGLTQLVEAPSPQPKDGEVLIATSKSLVSIGTERMLVEFGQANLFDKARQQPDKVKMVINKVQTDGLLTTIDTVRAKLAQPIPLGYCNVGTVLGGGNNTPFREGDRVVSNAPHADIVRVPKNLCAKVPDCVSDEEASFTVVASIGLQGIRLAKPTLGEAFVVVGVGLIGLLTVQLLKAHGCRVLAIDYDDSKLQLAKRYGAHICNPAMGQNPIAEGLAFSRGRGVDGVIITASTKSSEPVSQAANMCRKRGRIILVGIAGLELNRADFYEKEISFQVSCSYGPGRYDTEYEEKGNDYPYGFVRWTEQRNFEAVLDMMASGKLDVEPLVTHRFPFEEAEYAYQELTSDKAALGIVLEYDSDIERRIVPAVTLDTKSVFVGADPIIGFIGAGNYASRVLIPAFKAAGGQLHTISTSGGTSSVIAGKKGGFSVATADTKGLINDGNINTVVIVTRHNSHASLVCQALAAGKNVFVEKPLAITSEEILQIEEVYRASSESEKRPYLMVGFNRRFSPQIQKMKELLSSVSEPKSFVMTVNAGAIPTDHWAQDCQVGGGRIIGEACHFIDLMRFLAGSKIVSIQARRMGLADGVETVEDKATIMLGFADGSFGSIHYFANGANDFPKERVEVFTAGRTIQLDNFRKLRAFGWTGFRKMNLWQQDKGQNACVKAFLHAVSEGLPPPISAEEIFEVAKVSVEASELLRAQL